MICNECGSDMYLDDTDFSFKGCYDEYYCCKNCQTSCIVETRYSKKHKQIWHSENDNKVKDYIIKN